MPGPEKNWLYACGTVFALLLVALLAFAAPVTAATITTDPSGSGSSDISNFNAAITSAGSGGTVILNPGTYYLHGIPISTTITIRANTSYGGTAANTIIDGTKSGSSIFSVSSGSVTFDSLTFTNSSAGNGGAIYHTGGTISSIANTTFTGCSATYGGGAIYNYPGCTIQSITNTMFTGCSANAGGAIFNDGGTIQSISFSRFYSNTAQYGPAISNYGTLTSSINNWWGSNSDPSGLFFGRAFTYSPWLVLNATASSSSVTIPQNIAIQVNLTNNSAGTNTVSLGHVPDGIPVAYSVSGITGTFAPAQGNTTTGANTTVFTPTSFGAGTIAVAVDGETISVPVTVTAIPLTGTGAITGTPQVGSTLTAGAVAPSGATYDLQWNRSASSTGPFTPIPGATGSTYMLTSADLGMYLEVNATGTGSYTGSINSTPVGPVTAAPTQTPPTSHGRQNTHSRSSGGSADVGYTGPQPTVMGYQPTQMATTQQPTGVPAVQQFSRPTLVAAVTPGTGTSAGFPVTIVALISGACVVVAGSAWYIRRWWIHRQNPALFKKYD